MRNARGKVSRRLCAVVESGECISVDLPVLQLAEHEKHAKGEKYGRDGNRNGEHDL